MDPYTCHPAPQANSLPVLCATVVAVAHGARDDAAIAAAIGYSTRQGAYYPNAAGELGLLAEVFHTPRQWALTALGDQLARADAAGRVDLLAELLCGNAWIDLYMSDGEALEVKLADAGYASNTVARRAATIASWAKFLFETSRELQVHEIASFTREADSRLAAYRPARRAAVPTPLSVCPECFLPIPAAVPSCPSCG